MCFCDLQMGLPSPYQTWYYENPHTVPGSQLLTIHSTYLNTTPTHPYFPLTGEVYIWNQRNKAIILTHFAVALIFPISPDSLTINRADCRNACFWGHSWSTAAFLLSSTANKLLMTLADVFAFKPTGTLWTVLNFFLFLLSQGQLLELSRFGKLLSSD